MKAKEKSRVAQIETELKDGNNCILSNAVLVLELKNIREKQRKSGIIFTRNNR